MSETMKPTPGPWTVHHDPEGDDWEWTIRVPSDGITNSYEIAALTSYRPKHDEADARLIAEAGTVLHETGMTPRQLADAVKTLRDAAQKIIDMNIQWAADEWGDPSKAESMACVREARAALQATVGKP